MSCYKQNKITNKKRALKKNEIDSKAFSACLFHVNDVIEEKKNEGKTLLERNDSKVLSLFVSLRVENFKE